MLNIINNKLSLEKNNKKAKAKKIDKISDIKQNIPAIKE
jgi:hypothetical protein